MKRMTIHALLAGAFFCLAATDPCAGENLLINPTFAESAPSGDPKGWSLQGAGQELRLVADALPEGVNGAIEIRVTGEEKNHGALVQRIGAIKPDTEYVFSAWAKAGAAGGAYLQIKLYRDGKEVERINSSPIGTDWQLATVRANSKQADKLEVLCRVQLIERTAGKAFRFAAASLREWQGVTLSLAGDSTVADYPADSNTRGWGQMLPEFLQPEILVRNHAAGGRSTKTFRSEGRWEKLLAEKPQVVLIQFGHNDSHDKSRPEATDAPTDYAEYLRQYVTEARAAGAKPILVTPMHRRTFDRDGKLQSNLGPYAASMRSVAQELTVPLIDLYAFSERELQKRGSDGSIELYCSVKDRAHFSATGARWLAAEVARALGELVPEIRAHLRSAS